MYHINHMFTPPRFIAVIAARKYFNIFYLLSLVQDFELPHPSLPWGDFLKIKSLYPWVGGKASIKNEVCRLNTFSDVLLTGKIHKHTVPGTLSHKSASQENPS